MSETSRSRVTITLGRSGQVVKRDGSSFDSSNADLKRLVGSKRPVRERLGNSIDSAAPLNNKRLRKDDRATVAVEGIHLRKDDLRYKIMQKNFVKKSQSSYTDGADLRNVLSRPAQSSTNSISAQEKMPEPRDGRSHYLEHKDRRHYMAEPPRDGRRFMPVTRSSSQQLSGSRGQYLLNPRVQQLPEAIEGRRNILEPEDVRRHMPEISRSSIAGVPGMRSTHDVTKMESGIDFFSPWNLDHLRRKSPDEALTPYRALSETIRDAGLQRKHTVRELDEARTSTYKGKDAFEFSRPTNSSSYMSKMALPVGSMRTTIPLVSTRPASSSLAQNSSYMVDDHSTVDIFLRSLGLEKFAILFKAEEVDMYSLKRMSDSDLKELGIPMGPRKKIMLSLQPRIKRQA